MSSRFLFEIFWNLVEMVTAQHCEVLNATDWYMIGSFNGIFISP